MPKQHPAVNAMAIANPAVIARRTLVLTNGGCLECADQCRLPLRTGVTAVLLISGERVDFCELRQSRPISSKPLACMSNHSQTAHMPTPN